MNTKTQLNNETGNGLALDLSEVFSSDNIFAERDDAEPVSLSDALFLSIADRGKVDIPYISKVTGKELDMVINGLHGQIFQNPETFWEDPYDGWETAGEYLSGNLAWKLKAAKEAHEKYDRFSENIKALERNMPESVETKDIFITLGSPYVPTHIIDEFIEYLFDGHSTTAFYVPYSQFSNYKVRHDAYEWEIPYKLRYGRGLLNNYTYGTERMGALEILEKTLNLRTAVVYDAVESNTTGSGIAHVVNEEETMLAIEKQKLLIHMFKTWVWKDPKRKAEITKIYEERFASTINRTFDGSYLSFPGMSEKVSLYDYQRNAVARILLTKNTLLAHEVGSGKTYVMIAAGMELKRIGLSQKNLFVVPNNILGQWETLFQEMYPSANILCVEPKSFTPDKKHKVLKAIRDEEYDAVIMAYSCFDRIPLSQAYYLSDLREQKNKLEQLTADKNRTTPAGKRTLKTISSKLSKLSVAEDENKDLICFDQLGITRLFVDEAHNYKNVPMISSGAGQVRGINTKGSKKCQLMLDKVRFIQKQNNGGGVVMATGTPITNSITDIFVMQKYLQEGELSLLDLQNFESWIGMFAERSTEFEIDVDTNSYHLVTRFSRFHNLPELSSLISSFADFHMVGSEMNLPVFMGYSDISVPPNSEFKDYLCDISERADAVRKARVNRKEDNLLKITIDGRKSALDLRLIDSELQLSGKTKTDICAEQIADIYYSDPDNVTLQLVFCDLSVPKEGFNLYDELKNRLVQHGIRENEIAYIHDADTEAKRKQLFKSARNGSVRVLIGSTAKLGHGVNVQEHLRALHHLDVPWKPSDMIQREGRILRQGNLCRKVDIFRYYTEGSFDAYSWQLLEMKQRFIKDLLSGVGCEREAGDINDMVLSYAQVKALSVGNPLLKKRCEIANELSRLRTLQRKYVESNHNLERKLEQISEILESQRQTLAGCQQDLTAYCDWKERDANQNLSGKEKRQEKNKRRKFRYILEQALDSNVLRSKERFLADYKGFKIVLPQDMTAEDPYLWLIGTSMQKYKVAMGTSDQGYLVRIDHFLENFSKRMEDMEKRIVEKEIELNAIEEELSKENGFAERILELKDELELIDIELEVTSHE